MPEPDDTPPATAAVPHVCPYCGLVSPAAPESCPQCQMHDTPETRAATSARVGPWYVLQGKNPTLPGMNFATLLSLVRRGRVTPTSVVRGPTTQQLWATASRVKGLSREFGTCYACGAGVEQSANVCPACHRLQEPPMNPDALLEHKPPSNPPPKAPRQPHAPAPLPEAGLPGLHQGRILTTRELAAAFALQPETGVATPEQAVEPPRRGHPIRKVLLTAVLFAMAISAAYLVIDPKLREKVRTHLLRAGDWAQAQWSTRLKAGK